MKKKYLLYLLLITAMPGIQRAAACDVCGCAANANYFGILPQYGQHFAGLRYTSSRFTSSHMPSLFETSQSPYHESLQRMEVWGRFYPAKRIQLYAFIPYQYNTRNDAGVVTTSQGLSDISVMGNYILINTGDSGRLSWRNTLSLGGGVKAPTGRFDPSGAASLQTGTGTWDYLLNAIYTTRYKQLGLNADVNVRLNTANADYRYGNRYTSSVRLFYWHRYKLVSILPHTGILAEYAQKDRKYGIDQYYTGGNGYYSATGIDVYFRRISVGCIYTVPLSETLNAGYEKTNQRVSVQALYLF